MDTIAQAGSFRPGSPATRAKNAATGRNARRREQTGVAAVFGDTSNAAPSSLDSLARQLVAPGKGLLAADESFPTIEKRFKKLDIPSTEENRRAYREMLFTTGGLGDFISGVILFDETLRQNTHDGIPLAAVLERRGIVPGIKVDKGTVPLANFPEEKITEGLDGLRERLKEYYSFGARFTKWRAVITIGESLPSRTCREANAVNLARFAALSQEAGLVPIVEPEILMDGSHFIDRCETVTNETLPVVFAQLSAHRVKLSGMLLKPAMVLPGAESGQQVSDDEIAQRTVAALKRGVPAEVAGIVFLSGGQSPEQATRRLAAICRGGSMPWPLTFSFGRALQDLALNAWKGRSENAATAQSALLRVAQANSAAVAR